MHDEYWGVTAIAEYLNITVQSAYSLSKRPDFPAPQMNGKNRRWPSRDVMAWDAGRNHAGISNRSPLREYKVATRKELDANRAAAKYRRARGIALHSLHRAGFSATDIADMTGISPATVYTLMSLGEA